MITFFLNTTKKSVFILWNILLILRNRFFLYDTFIPARMIQYNIDTFIPARMIQYNIDTFIPARMIQYNIDTLYLLEWYNTILTQIILSYTYGYLLYKSS